MNKSLPAFSPSLICQSLPPSLDIQTFPFWYCVILCLEWQGDCGHSLCTLVEYKTLLPLNLSLDVDPSSSSWGQVSSIVLFITFLFFTLSGVLGRLCAFKQACCFSSCIDFCGTLTPTTENHAELLFRYAITLSLVGSIQFFVLLSEKFFPLGCYLICCYFPSCFFFFLHMCWLLRQLCDLGFTFVVLLSY